MTSNHIKVDKSHTKKVLNFIELIAQIICRRYLVFEKYFRVDFIFRFSFFQGGENIFTELVSYLAERRYCIPTKQAKDKRKTESQKRRNKSRPFLKQDHVRRS